MAEVEEGPGIGDNKVLDQFEIPFGDWMEQTVKWIDVHLDWLLSAIKWPFEFLLTNLVNGFLIQISWIWIVLAFFIVGSLVRNIKVGAFSALALTTCGLLGNAYWLETARTIGFIFVSVLLCVAIGVPVGVACGRIDGFWKVVRPLLDAMQVVHSFVYMLPFIFFFGIGPVSATMVTMVFALPPLIRLTNLGIRQVPEDVVEASRAFGAPEWRVLTDVQLPLARPAIMTGLNQTLLLAISMLGIAAIMGAGGLGQLLFRALSNQDVAFATSGGLAFFLVAVVLDRISQSDDGDGGSLFHRIRRAWAHRSDPETLIPEPEIAELIDRPQAVAWQFAAVSPSERLWMIVAGLGGAIAALSVFLTWGTGGAKLGGFGRRMDEVLDGESFNGLSASGGSWFGFITLALGLFVVAAVGFTMLSPGKGPRWLTTDGAVMAAVGLFVSNLAYALAWAPAAGTHSTGIGVWVALVGSSIAAAGSIVWILSAPHSALHPLSKEVAWGRIIGVSLALLTLGIGAFSAWSFDGRQDVVFSPELEAKIAELREEAAANPQDAGPIAAEISAAMASARKTGDVVSNGIKRNGFDGTEGTGSGLGIWSLAAGVAGLATMLMAGGLFGALDEHASWVWSTITAGIGAGAALIGVGWIATHVRSADPNYISGMGSFLTVCGGAFIVASSAAVLKEFRRSKIYSDNDQIDLTATPVTEVASNQKAQMLS